MRTTDMKTTYLKTITYFCLSFFLALHLSSFSAFSEILETFPDAADFDNDGRLDTVNINSNGTLEVFLASGKNPLTQFQQLIFRDSSFCNGGGSERLNCQRRIQTISNPALRTGTDLNNDGFTDLELNYFLLQDEVQFGVPLFQEDIEFNLVYLGNGNGTFTEVNELTPIFPNDEQTTVIWNTYLDILNISEVLNNSFRNFNLNTELFQSDRFSNLADDTGYPIPPLPTFETEAFAIERDNIITPLPANVQQDVIVNGSSLSGVNRIGLLNKEDPIIDNVPGQVPGRLMSYRFNETGSLDFMLNSDFSDSIFGVSSVSYNTFSSDFRQVITQNLLAIANTSSENIDFDIEFFKNSDSEPIGTLEEFIVSSSLSPASLQAESFSTTTEFRSRNITVASGESAFLDAGEFLGEFRSGIVLITPSSNESGYTASLSRFSREAIDSTNYTFANSQLAKKSTTGTSFVPISKGASANNWLELSNPSNRTTELVVDFIQGSTPENNISLPITLGPREQVHLHATSYLTNSISGFAQISPATDSDEYIAQGFIYYPTNFENPFLQTSASYSNDSLKLENHCFVGSFNTNLEMANWLRVSNPNNSAIEVILEIDTEDGVKNALYVIPANTTRDIGLLADFESNASVFGVPNNSFGILRLQSNDGENFFGEIIRVQYQDNFSVGASAATTLFPDEACKWIYTPQP